MVKYVDQDSALTSMPISAMTLTNATRANIPVELIKDALTIMVAFSVTVWKDSCWTLRPTNAKTLTSVKCIYIIANHHNDATIL